MPYALFYQDAKLSKAYPTEADVWKLARKSGLVVDAVSEEDKASPRPVLDNDYEIRPCQPEPNEDPVKNKADADREARLEPRLNRGTAGRPVRMGGPDMLVRPSCCRYGVAVASDACSAASDTQIFRRCRPRIDPVTLSTLPTVQEASCTKTTS